jgi:hypothetical protein
VPIEVVVGFLPLGKFEFSQILWLTVGKTLGVGTLVILPSFSLFAGRSKIDQFSHVSPRR